jgi:hypothetical protein
VLGETLVKWSHRGPIPHSELSQSFASVGGLDDRRILRGIPDLAPFLPSCQDAKQLGMSFLLCRSLADTVVLCILGCRHCMTAINVFPGASRRCFTRGGPPKAREELCWVLFSVWACTVSAQEFRVGVWRHAPHGRSRTARATRIASPSCTASSIWTVAAPRANAHLLRQLV